MYMRRSERGPSSVDGEDTGSAPRDRSQIPNMRVAMLGDDRSQIFSLRNALLTAGHTAQRYKTLAEFLSAVNNTSFDALVIGIFAQEGAPLDVLARVRSELKLTVPVIVVTPPQGEDYVVGALRAGADDCIQTPVGQREFLARLEAVSRRWMHVPPSVRSFQVGRLTVNIESRRILLDDEAVDLTSKDFDLALYLLRNTGRLVSRNQILHSVWGWNHQLVRSRTLDTHVSRVRTRLMLVESHGWRLSAVYRRGYRLERLKEPLASEAED